MDQAVSDPRQSIAAVLFTDLVGSTEMRTRLGEDLADQLQRRHDRLRAGDQTVTALAHEQAVAFYQQALALARDSARTYGFAGVERRAHALLANAGGTFR